MLDSGRMIAASDQAIELSLQEPGEILDGAARLDFCAPAPAPFRLRLGRQPFLGGEAAQVLEVHQPHPRGTAWATLEFALAGLPANARLRFDARLLPNMPVVLKIYTASSEHDIAAVPVNHRINAFRVGIDAELAERASHEQGLRLGFTLPQRSWFVFQIANLSLRSEAATAG